jgi:hypothetical protein
MTDQFRSMRILALSSRTPSNSHRKDTEAWSDCLYDLLPNVIGGIPVGIVKTWVSLAQFAQGGNDQSYGQENKSCKITGCQVFHITSL